MKRSYAKHAKYVTLIITCSKIKNVNKFNSEVLLEKQKQIKNKSIFIFFNYLVFSMIDNSTFSFQESIHAAA